MTSLLNYKWVLLFFAVSIVCFLVGHFVETIFMAFGAGLFSIGLVLASFLFILEKVLGGVDDKKHILEERNIAYAIYVASIAGLICVAYASAFVVFLALK
jgi:hypothetical protein